ncbi:glycerophosphodiester phosphodiesterase [Geoalkalibacter halelectricus]|uniref:Glycerophosphodiester phosphodiesterase n=1 Tax=Geoalkalibacter halelectricus TaxID=2847045 RepID=A0ABY5ZIY4_9BACT|nr:glycerophosphodiester phosphodiesterase [Geoalkalibacter halelectricus]MDO3379621.1 glycerophosphodiester phosphodiesterase [Geoalkalibacter halelectricus]UWZ78563.1 glycerophosphodiester phosphodiesterase [Geoalkalibacter halelectricus]
MSSLYLSLPRPRLFGHRGSSAAFPENTLPAFQASVAAGLPYLELDVWATQDGTVMVHHDPSLSRTCGVDLPLSSLPFDEVRCQDAGYTFAVDGGRDYPFRGRGIQIPTLEEVLLTFPKTRVNIEIKQVAPPIEALVVEAVRRCCAQDRVLIASEHDEVLARLRPLCPEIPTNFGFQETSGFFAWARGGCRGPYQPPGQALQIPSHWQRQKLVTAEALAAARHAGVEVHVWTINMEAEMRALLALGVDGLMSDYPELLAKVADEICRPAVF